MHPPDESATALGAFFCLVWLAILLWWLVGKSHVIAETVAWFRRKAVPAKIFIVCAFCAVLTYGSIKSGGNDPQGLPRPPLLLRVLEPPPEPAIAPVSVWTNGVALRAETTNAVEVTAFRTVGGTELGDWIETAAPFFAVGTQMGTNGVNALSILGTNILAATVWNVDGAPVTNGVSIADLLCTNGVLRTPASFEIRWKNTTGLDPEADTDDDGLTDWEETFVWGTEANFADTDGDGRSDGDEIAWGDDPFDADENGDGVPDGMGEEEWLANPLWAANSTNGANVVVSLNAAVPQGTSATLILGDLAIPLRSPGTWAVSLVPGQMYDFRLKTNGRAPVDITLMPPAAEPLETGGELRSMSPPPSGMNGGSPVWVDPKDALDGPTGDVAGKVAAPILSVVWVRDSADSHDSIDENICLHSEDEWAMFQASVLPNGMGITADDLTCRGLTQIGTGFGLRVPEMLGITAEGSILLGDGKLRGGGWLQCDVSAHRMAPSQNGSHCAICDFYGIHIDDVSLHVRSPLTLKHDNAAPIVFHCEKPDHGPASNPVIRIRRVGTTEWYTLAQSFSHLWMAKIAGFFELKGVATMDGDIFETAPVVVEVQLPSYSEIASDDAVLQLGQTLWNRVLEDCSETGRREHGCWIALDSFTEIYYGINFRTGDWATASSTPGVFLPLKGLYEGGNDIPLPTASGAVYPVATIHAHTPTTYSESGRDVGPSGADLDNAVLLAAPGIVLDFLPAYDATCPTATNRIPAGHPMESPYRQYPAVPPIRRPTPP